MSTPTSPESSATVGNFIVLMDESDTFTWTFEDMRGTSFELRVVPDEQHAVYRRQHTKRKNTPSGVQEITDWDTVSHLSLVYAVRSVAGLRRRDPGDKTKTVEIVWSALSPADQDRVLHFLPERVKVEILRLCVSKEAGLERDAGKKS